MHSSGFRPSRRSSAPARSGHVILNTTTDQPWSQYFCCMLAGNREFVRDHPVATKRVLRAILKATDLCAAEPERAARGLVARGFTERYDYALQTLTELPYGAWREFDPEDSLRFFALRMHEARHDQVEPQRAPRRRHRLALPERAQARAEGVSQAPLGWIGSAAGFANIRKEAFRCRASSRRDFLASLSAAGAAGVVARRSLLADEPPPRGHH